MSRSIYKNTIYQHRKIFNVYKILNMEPNKLGRKDTTSFLTRYRSILRAKTFTIFKKSSTIRSPIVMRSVKIHDGLFLQRVIIKQAMFLHKFGQFVFTKRMGNYIHKDNKLAKKKAKALKQLLSQSQTSSKKSESKSSKKKKESKFTF